MNENIEKILNQDFRGFLKLIELGVIDKKISMKTIINSKNPYFIYEFAYYIKDADIEKLTDAIIKTKNVYYIYFFARDIKGSDSKRLIDEIEKIENAEKKEKVLESKLKLTTLLQLLEEKKFEEISKNKEKYSQLFINDVPNNKEITRTLKRKNDNQ